MFKRKYNHDYYGNECLPEAKQQLQIPDHFKCGEVYTWLCAGELYAIECKLCEDHPLCPLSEFSEHMDIWHTNWEETTPQKYEDDHGNLQHAHDDDHDHDDNHALLFNNEDSGLFEPDQQLQNERTTNHEENYVQSNEEILEPFEQVLIEQDFTITTTTTTTESSSVQVSEDVNEEEYFKDQCQTANKYKQERPLDVNQTYKSTTNKPSVCSNEITENERELHNIREVLDLRESHDRNKELNVNKTKELKQENNKETFKEDGNFKSHLKNRKEFNENIPETSGIETTDDENLESKVDLKMSSKRTKNLTKIRKIKQKANNNIRSIRTLLEIGDTVQKYDQQVFKLKTLKPKNSENVKNVLNSKLNFKNNGKKLRGKNKIEKSEGEKETSETEKEISEICKMEITKNNTEILNKNNQEILQQIENSVNIKENKTIKLETSGNETKIKSENHTNKTVLSNREGNMARKASESIRKSKDIQIETNEHETNARKIENEMNKEMANLKERTPDIEKSFKVKKNVKKCRKSKRIVKENQRQPQKIRENKTETSEIKTRYVRESKIEGNESSLDMTQENIKTQSIESREGKNIKERRENKTKLIQTLSELDENETNLSKRNQGKTSTLLSDSKIEPGTYKIKLNGNETELIKFKLKQSENKTKQSENEKEKEHKENKTEYSKNKSKLNTNEWKLNENEKEQNENENKNKKKHSKIKVKLNGSERELNEITEELDETKIQTITKTKAELNLNKSETLLKANKTETFEQEKETNDNETIDCLLESFKIRKTVGYCLRKKEKHKENFKDNKEYLKVSAEQSESELKLTENDWEHSKNKIKANENENPKEQNKFEELSENETKINKAAEIKKAEHSANENESIELYHKSNSALNLNKNRIEKGPNENETIDTKYIKSLIEPLKIRKKSEKALKRKRNSKRLKENGKHFLKVLMEQSESETENSELSENEKELNKNKINIRKNDRKQSESNKKRTEMDPNLTESEASYSEIDLRADLVYPEFPQYLRKTRNSLGNFRNPPELRETNEKETFYSNTFNVNQRKLTKNPIRVRETEQMELKQQEHCENYDEDFKIVEIYKTLGVTNKIKQKRCKSKAIEGSLRENRKELSEEMLEENQFLNYHCKTRLRNYGRDREEIALQSSKSFNQRIDETGERKASQNALKINELSFKNYVKPSKRTKRKSVCEANDPNKQISDSSEFLQEPGGNSAIDPLSTVNIMRRKSLYESEKEEREDTSLDALIRGNSNPNLANLNTSTDSKAYKNISAVITVMENLERNSNATRKEQNSLLNPDSQMESNAKNAKQTLENQFFESEEVNDEETLKSSEIFKKLDCNSNNSSISSNSRQGSFTTPTTEPLSPLSPKTEEEHFEFYEPQENPKLNKQHISHLIKLYQEHPHLWDQSHPEFCEPQVCRKSWQQITDQWNEFCKRKFTIAEVRIRICTLCQRFVQERERLLLEGELDECAKFPHYEQMQFLEQQKSLQQRRELYEQQNEKLLEIYQNFPILWHVGCYRLRQAKERAQAFESISLTLKLCGIHLSCLAVQKRIRSLRKCYRLEKIRYLHAQVEQMSFNSDFRHYQSMKFLEKHMDPFVCRSCGKIFENLQGYREHLESENHGRVLSEESETENDLDTEAEEDNVNTISLVLGDRNENKPESMCFSSIRNPMDSFSESDSSRDVLQRFTPLAGTPNPSIDTLSNFQLNTLENSASYIQEDINFPLNTPNDPIINSLRLEDQLMEEIMETVTNDVSLSQQGLDQFLNSVTNCENLSSDFFETDLFHTENSFVVEHPDIVTDQTLSVVRPTASNTGTDTVSHYTENPYVMEHSDIVTDPKMGILSQAQSNVENCVPDLGNSSFMKHHVTTTTNPAMTKVIDQASKCLSAPMTVEDKELNWDKGVQKDTETLFSPIPQPLETLSASPNISDTELYSLSDISTTPLTDNLIHKLIEFYRKFPQLWNPNHLDYNSRNLRRQAWYSLTNEFNCAVGKQLSWRTLHRKLTDLGKYYKKLITEQENYEQLENKWAFYDDFKFMDDVIDVHDELQRNVHHRANNFKIIALYKTLPQLWNIKHPDYNKRCTKQRNIESMCNRLQEENNLQLTTERLKNRLIELRAQYRAAKKQRLKCLKNQQQFASNNFEFYEALQFLDDHIDPFICDNCKMEFKKLTDYNQHLRKVHSSRVAPNNQTLTLPPPPPPPHGLVGENICHICSMKFTTRSNLLHHIRRHEGIRNHACTWCSKKFYASHALKVHIRSHTKECPYTCEKCGMSFVSASKLNLHFKRHSNRKDYQCDFCSKTFYTAFEKDRHEKRHLNIRDKTCAICGKTFVAGSSYYAHLMLHSDTKRFECDKCDMKFAQYAGLYKHKKRHHT